MTTAKKTSGARTAKTPEPETPEPEAIIDELPADILELPVHQVVLHVSKLIGAVGKDGQAKASGEFGGFSYRSIDALINAIADPVHGLLLFTPQILTWSREGSVTIIHVEYSIIGPLGDVLEPKPNTLGYGSGLTGPGAAMSYARKVMLGELFTIPTDASIDTEQDPDPHFTDYDPPPRTWPRRGASRDGLLPEHLRGPDPHATLTVDQVNEVMALFAKIEDKELRKTARDVWLEEIPRKPHEMQFRDFESIKFSANQAIDYFLDPVEPEPGPPAEPEEGGPEPEPEPPTEEGQ